MNIKALQTAFTTGEISPRLKDRIDLDQYYSAAMTLENFLPTPQGPIIRRPGLTHIAELGIADSNCRLIPFTFDADQSFVLCFHTDGNIYFFFKQGIITGSDGQPYKVAHGFTEEEINVFDYAQSGDIVYLVCARLQPRKLIRKANDNWVIENEVFADNSEFAPTLQDTNYDEYCEMKFVAEGGSLSDLKAYKRIANNPAKWEQFAENFVSGGTYTVTAKRNGTDNLSMSAWGTAMTVIDGGSGTTSSMPSQWKAGNYPTLVAFYDQRLIYAATPNEPQTIWMSRIGLYNDFNKTGPDDQVLDDMAIEYTIASDDVNGIVWMIGLEGLMLGTSGGEYRVAASLAGEALTPNNTKVTKITNYGSAKTKPYPLGLGVAYVQRSRRAIRHVGPDQLGTYNSTDLMTLANHICEDGIKQMALQTNPYTILWCVTNSGKLVSLSYDKDNKVLAWSRHTIANGLRKVLSVTVIPGEDGKDEVWVASINTNTEHKQSLFLDAMLDAATETDKVEDSRFLDSYLYTLDKPDSKVISGLSHLAGQEVGILIDGWVHPNRVVSAEGTVTLDQLGNKIIIGLPFTSLVKTINFQSNQNNTAGSTRRIYKVGITLLNSLGCRVSAGAKEEEVYMGPTKIMNKAKELFSGTKIVPVSSTWEKELSVTVTQDKPLPCEVTNIIGYLSAN